VRSRSHHELRYMRRDSSVNGNDRPRDAEQVKDVSSNRAREDDGNHRTVFIRGAHLRTDRRQLDLKVVRMSSWAVMMVVSVRVAVMDVQHGGLSIEAEESHAQQDRDRSHPNQFT
jgi:hypothetical protein